jgi:hypothetical protein
VNIVSPQFESWVKGLPKEKQEQARRGFEAFTSGIVQSLLGNVRRTFVDQFLNALGPSEKVKIEFIADQIVGAKDSNRLRQKTMIGVVAAFESGIVYATEAVKRGENPGDMVASLHKIVMTHEVKKVVTNKKSGQ